MPTYLTRFTGCLLGTLLMFSAPAAIATETSTKIDSFEKQWYLGAGLGQSRVEPNTDGSGFRLDDKNDTGYKLFAGYDFTERFSLEGYFSRLGQAKLSPNGKVKYTTYGISALYYLYKSRQPHTGWGVFGRGGIGRMKNTADIPYELDNNNHIMYGAGVEYGFNNSLALRLDVDFYDIDAQLIAINIMKRFGADKKKPEPQPVAIMDSDNDGVIDSEDRCPDSPAGAVVDHQGCERDSDDDGVVDSRDKCPDTPAGTKVDSRGCNLDSDGDGITDHNDTCPDSPAGVNVDPRGCELDGDADGVVDSQDHCLETPTGTAVDANGCKLQTTIVLKGVTFATASSELVGDSRQALTEVVDTLRRNPELKVEIAGYTDNRGDHDYNVRLSQQRAESVRDYLIVQGIADERLVAKGYGPTDPIVDNTSEDGRATNRRVALHIIK